MKPTFSQRFFLTALIAFLSACKHDVPDQEDKDPSLLHFRVINKTSDPILAKVRDEIILIDGKEIRIGEESRISYTFDVYDRPVEATFSAKGFSDYAGSQAFFYEKNKLIQKTQNGSGAVDEVTFPLNDQGLLAERTYNSEGFAVDEGPGDYRTTNTVDKGNVVRKQILNTKNDSIFAIRTYEYDLTKLNLPNVAPHEGKASVNLPTKQISLIYPENGEPARTVTISYHYTFDSSGRPSGCYYQKPDSSGHYSVIEFEYVSRQ